jgi:hypothetical protein
MDEFTPVLEYINRGCYTINDLVGEFKEFKADELQESLEGFVLFKKISKTRQYFHGNSIIPPEKKTKTTTGNSLDLTNVDYPDWVKTDRDKVKFLTSPESPKLAKSMHFFVDDVDLKETGRLLFDSLNSNHIMTSVYLRPNTDTPGNKVDYSKNVTQFRGFNVLYRDGKFKVHVSLLVPLRRKYANASTEAVPDHFEKEFTTYEDFKKWILENL